MDNTAPPHRLKLQESSLAVCLLFASFGQSSTGMAATPQPPAPSQPDTQLKPLVVTGERPEEATGPVNGYVATRSASGTKTDTPIIETPQSISVIGQIQMEAQAAYTLGAALRYTPGVTAEEFGGAETRQDFFMVRGFAQNFPFVDGFNTQTFFSVLAPSIDTYHW